MAQPSLDHFVQDMGLDPAVVVDVFESMGGDLNRTANALLDMVGTGHGGGALAPGAHVKREPPAHEHTHVKHEPPTPVLAAVAIRTDEAGLPARLSSDDFRKLSQQQTWRTDFFGANHKERVPMVGPGAYPQRGDSDPLHRAHRLHNELLAAAYNAAPSRDVKAQILAMGYHTRNITPSRGATNVGLHKRQEAALDTGNPEGISVANKVRSMRSALDAFIADNRVDFDGAVAQVLETMLDRGEAYAEFVATLKKTTYRTPAIKAQIDRARKMRKSAARADAAAKRAGERAEKSGKGTVASGKKGKGSAAREQQSPNKPTQRSARGDGPRKADGTPDMRYKANRQRSPAAAAAAAAAMARAKGPAGPVKADGTPDMRYKANQTAGSSSSSRTTSASSPSAGPMKANGTPDMRYKANKTNRNLFGGSSTTSGSSPSAGPMKADGTPDMRYKVNQTSSSGSHRTTRTSSSSGPLKADGTPDMRYKANQTSSSGSHRTTRTSSPSGPLKADGTPDMRYKANRASYGSYRGSGSGSGGGGSGGGPLKADGTPDMRFKANRRR